MAATVAGRDLAHAKILPYTVGTGGTTAGRPVKFSASKTVVLSAAVGDLSVGIALETVAAGGTAQVALFGYGVAKVLVGTGDATRGEFAEYVSNGATDVTVGGGTTLTYVLGQWLESGVAGDLREMNLGPAGPNVKA